MKRRLAGSLGLSLGMLLGGARAADVQWRPAASRAAVVQPQAFSEAPAPVCSLGAPVALGQPIALPPRVTDPQVTAASYSSPAELSAPQPLFRAQAPDYNPPLPPPPPPGPPVLPPGPPVPPPPAAGPAPGRSRLWLRAEYLAWWFKDSPEAVPLVTTGVLGAPGTEVLLGGKDIEDNAHQGIRFTAGYWFDCDHTYGIEADYFFLANHSVTRSVASSGAPGSTPLFVPVVLEPAGTEAALAIPGLLPGQDTLRLSSRLQGAELDGVLNLSGRACLRLDLLGGFRYLNLREDLTFATSTSVGGDLVTTRDDFDARNNFYGAQLGARAEYTLGRFFVNGTGKLAVGEVHETVNISGSTTMSGAGLTVTSPGGIFAESTNSGSHSRNRLAAAPELGFNVGFQFADWGRVFAGYSFLYLSDVARPGNEIDRGMGAGRPAFTFHDSDFWAQGINLGLEFRY